MRDFLWNKARIVIVHLESLLCNESDFDKTYETTSQFIIGGPHGSTRRSVRRALSARRSTLAKKQQLVRMAGVLTVNDGVQPPAHEAVDRNNSSDKLESVTGFTNASSSRTSCRGWWRRTGDFGLPGLAIRDARPILSIIT